MTRKPQPGRACLICGKPPEPGYRPFCSGRCANVDLQRWLNGSYAVPAAEDDGDPAADLDPDQDE